MTISLSVLDVLLFLLPGFVWFGIAYDNRTTIIHSVLPNAGSIAILTLVPLMALTVHALWSGVFLLFGWCAEHGIKIAEVSFEPNIYKWIFKKDLQPNISDAGVFYGFLMLIIISATPVFAYWLRWPIATEKVIAADSPRQDKEDWLHYLIRRASPDEFWLCAFITTKIEKDGHTLGYSGFLDRIGRTNEGDISFVVIDDVRPFVMKVSEDGAEILDSDQEHGMGMVTFHREDYHSIRFEVQALATP